MVLILHVGQIVGVHDHIEGILVALFAAIPTTIVALSTLLKVTQGNKNVNDRIDKLEKYLKEFKHDTKTEIATIKAAINVQEIIEHGRELKNQDGGFSIGGDA